jgi:LysM repeat protein
MEMNQPPPRSKLRATTARRGNPRDVGSDSLHYDAEPEPNMRLSRAIAVVLILHIVAIGGVLAFSLIKDRAPQPTTKSKPTSAPPATAPATNPATAMVAGPGLIPPTSAKRSEPIIAAQKSPAVTQISTTTATPAKTQKTTPYIVRQGDTLARIANENGISLGALIAVNEARVTTTNLKPGQEIQLPVMGTPKDRPQDEATRLIETSGPATPAKSAPVLAKSVVPAATVPMPATAIPIPATLVAKPSTSTVAPAPATAKPATPPHTMAKPVVQHPIMAKATPPAPKVEKAIPVQTESKPATMGSASWEARTYVVLAGDNPDKLARKFGVTENALLKANGLSDAQKLKVGQRLVIPSRKPKF